MSSSDAAATLLALDVSRARCACSLHAAAVKVNTRPASPSPRSAWSIESVMGGASGRVGVNEDRFGAATLQTARYRAATGIVISQ